MLTVLPIYCLLLCTTLSGPCMNRGGEFAGGEKYRSTVNMMDGGGTGELFLN